jgi:Domain of unknown function (DUF397)
MELPRPTALRWRKSSFSVSGDCVEVASDGTNVFVRDSKDRDGQILSFSASAWRCFLTTIREGDTFDLEQEE